MKSEAKSKLTALALAIAVSAFSSSAFAQKAGGAAAEGAVGIDQTKALNGGVTANDTAGFPVTLSQPGHYRLTGNLTVSDPMAQAIYITAPNVTLDLNGFTIQGPNKCVALTKSCSVMNGFGIGVYVGGTGALVHNGTIEGFANGGVMGMGGTFRDLRVTDNTVGLQLNNAPATFERLHVERNLYTGISMSSTDHAVVRSSTIIGNFGNGIQMQNGLVHNNVIRLNGGRGLNAPGIGVSGYRENVITSNAMGDVYGGTSLGNNACSNQVVC